MSHGIYLFLINDRKPRAIEMNIDDDDSADEKLIDKQENPIFYDVEDKEYDNDWDKFFKPNADVEGEYSNELRQNINEAKSMVKIVFQYGTSAVGCRRTSGVLWQFCWRL